MLAAGLGQVELPCVDAGCRCRFAQVQASYLSGSARRDGRVRRHTESIEKFVLEAKSLFGPVELPFGQFGQPYDCPRGLAWCKSNSLALLANFPVTDRGALGLLGADELVPGLDRLSAASRVATWPNDRQQPQPPSR